MSGSELTIEPGSGRANPTGSWAARLWIVLISWFAAIWALANARVFVVAEGALPVAIAAAAIAPPLLFLALYRLSTGLRAWVASLDLAIVIATQTWRVVGAVFLFLWALGSLPGVFAFPAGVGDVAVGVAAAFVTVKVARRADGWATASYWLIAAGMTDFVVAFGTAILSDPGRLLAISGAPTAELLEQLPIVLIPAFAVPGFIILHLIAWLKLRQEAGPMRGARSSLAPAGT